MDVRPMSQVYPSIVKNQDKSDSINARKRLTLAVARLVPGKARRTGQEARGETSQPRSCQRFAQATHGWFSLTHRIFLFSCLATLGVSVFAENAHAQNNPPVFYEGTSTVRSTRETFVNLTAQSETPIGDRVDASDTDLLTYSLEGPDGDKFTITPSTGQIKTKVGERYDYEADPSLEVTVKADDGNGGTATIAVTINLINNTNEKPVQMLTPTVTTGSATSLHVSWQVPFNEGRPEITGYDLRYRPGTSGPWTDGPQDVTGTSTQITCLAQDTEYQVQVRANNEDGDGPWSGYNPGRTAAQTQTPEQTCPSFATQAFATPEPEIVFVPLTARFRDVPAEHDGSTAFTLQLAFSEPIETTQAAIPQALTVTGGAVTSARQVDDHSNLWEITVTPNGNDDVRISLLPTTSCVAGAVCTADERTLSRGVAVSVPRAPLTARFESLPAGHDGSTAFAVQLAFSEPIETTEAAIRQMLMVTHGTVTSVRQVDNRSDRWEITAIPHSNADVSMSLLATPSCDADNAICTADGRMLSQGVAVSVPRAPLTARFESLPTGHDSSTEFALQLVFSEPIWLTAPALRTALTVTGGRVTGTRRVGGRSDLWEIIIQPNANDVRIALPPTTSCNANGAVCTQDGLVLKNDAQVVIPLATQTGEDAPPEVEPLIARFENLPAGHDGTTAFALQLVFSEPIERTKAAEIQQALAVIGGAVTSARRVNGSSDLWETTIQPNPNDVRIALPPTPSCDADNAICTADGRMLSQGVAASVVYRAPLTVRFESLPTEHDGTTEFALQLAFNQPIWLTEAVMRTQALTVTGGRVTSARRVDGRSDRWEIAIQPDANDVGISLLPTTSCNTNGAVCTQDGRALSNGLSATVTGPAAKSVAALQTFALYANYPNPFNAETQMTYALPVAGAVELAIYNVRGQRVRTLVQGVQAAGRYQIVWDGRNDTGAALASGVYLSRLASTQGVRVRQLLLIK